jgi:hypothetical protein
MVVKRNRELVVMLRVEKKYYLEKNDYQLLLLRIKHFLDKDKNAINGKYTISSIYFDDEFNTSWCDSENGNPVRDKYRIRIYNNNLDLIKLEIKRKVYSYAKKISANITYDDLQLILSGKTIDNPHKNEAIELFNMQISFANMKPVVIVTYDRVPFVCDEGNVRITFDYNLRASVDFDCFGNNCYEMYPLFDQPVLEVKYDQYLPDTIAQLLEINSMTETNNSKFKICRELIEENNL